MSGPVYKLWLAKPTEVWYQLSDDEQQAIFAELNQALARVGGKAIILCNSGWSSEQWPLFGVEEYPNIEAVQALSEAHQKLKWYRYVTSKTVLGTEYASAQSGA